MDTIIIKRRSGRPDGRTETETDACCFTGPYLHPECVCACVRGCVLFRIPYARTWVVISVELLEGLSSGDGEAGDGLGMVVQGTRGGFGGMRISAYQTDPKVRAKVREAPRCSVPSVAQRSLPAPPRVSAPCRDPFRLGWEQARENVPRGEGGGLSGFLLRLP